MITIHDLYFSYTGNAPFMLSGLNLEVPEGAYISIVGNNGCGKSTLLRLILGFLKPVKGGIHVDTSRIGYVPQRSEVNTGFPITVEEAIHSYGRLLHMKHIDTSSILSVTGMQDKKHELMGDLSGGQHQKVLIARALMGKPELLILDEPSTGVDVKSQQEIYSKLYDLNRKEGLTILAVEHNLEAATRNSTMMYHIASGQGHLCTPEHYISEYLSSEGGSHA
jgi:zinc transport system ATP-binding protein